MLVASIDAGASSTKILVVDVDRLRVWRGLGGPGNPVNAGVEAAARNIREALSSILEEEGLDFSSLKLVVAGFAGLDSRIVAGEVAPRLARLTGLGDKLVVEHDAHIAWYHATRGSKGVLVIAGTGSIAYTVHEGRRIIVGDHGWLLGDEGSGFWVAAQALRRLLRALDGRSGHDCLTRGLMRLLSIRDADSLAYWFYTVNCRVERIAEVAGMVARLADAEGCREAGELMALAAERLAEAAVHAARVSGSSTVYVTGGMFGSLTFSSAFQKTLGERGLRVSRRLVLPVLGGLAIALERIGLADPWPVADSPQVVTAAKSLYQHEGIVGARPTRKAWPP